MQRDFYADLCEVLPNKELAKKIGERIARDSVMFAFAGFYQDNPKLKLSEVLANMVLYMSEERRQLEAILEGREGGRPVERRP